MVEVLMSAMNLDDISIVNTANIHSSCLIINQCNNENEYINERPFGNVRMLNSKERGLSKSRNMALINSQADICVLCDDDIVYLEGYEIIIDNAFKQVPEADILVFNINSKNADIRPQEKYFTKVKKVPWYKMYSSVHIAFRRDKIIKSGITFDERFGAGSGKYSMAEDSIFFRTAQKSGLKAYVYPAVIADLYSEKSSWFHGYDERYFYDIGAFLNEAFPVMKYLFCFYYPIQLRGKTKLGFISCLRWIWKGIRGVKRDISYMEYINNGAI